NTRKHYGASASAPGVGPGVLKNDGPREKLKNVDRSHRLGSVARDRYNATRAAGARSQPSAAARPAAGAQSAGDSEAAARQRPAGLDRRAAQGAGRAGESARAQRYGQIGRAHV